MNPLEHRCLEGARCSGEQQTEDDRTLWSPNLLPGSQVPGSSLFTGELKLSRILNACPTYKSY